MVRVGEVVSLARTIERDAVRWYADNSVPNAFRGLNPMVLAEARLLCGGDWSRCVIDDDGSVTVYNHAMWTPEA